MLANLQLRWKLLLLALLPLLLLTLLVSLLSLQQLQRWLPTSRPVPAKA